jgi:hypothetical protein
VASKLPKNFASCLGWWKQIGPNLEAPTIAYGVHGFADPKKGNALIEE